MNTRFGLNIAFDVFILYCLWGVFTSSGFHMYGKNIALFVFWVQGITGLLFVLLPTSEDLEETFRKNLHYTPLAYSIATFAAEVIALSALGWFVTAAVYFLGGAVIISKKHEVLAAK